MTATRERRKRKVSPVALERMLQTPAAIAGWGEHRIEEAKKRVAHLRGKFYGRAAFVMSDDDELSNDPVGGFVGGTCCSHAWADDCFEFNVPYPPGGHRTPMIFCIVCGATVPCLVIESRRNPKTFRAERCCADCRSISDHEQFGPSVSGLAIKALGDLRMRLEEPAELAAEDDASLRREILLAETGKFVPEEG